MKNLAQRAITLERHFFCNIAAETELDQFDLKATTGIADQAVLDELLNADITPQTLVAFSYFPAVYVAWADGQMDEKEREAILKAAEQNGMISTPAARELLDSWLREKPSADLLSAWREFVSAVRPTIDDQSYAALQNAALTRARTIAEAAGGFLGLHKVSQQEVAALTQLKSVLNDEASTAIGGGPLQ